jgi:hypothetical protein
MADRNLPTPEELHNLLRYEPETGRLYWRERTPEMYSGPRAGATCKRFNTKFAGAEAMASIDSNGYRHGYVWGSLQRTHRVICAMINGSWPTSDIDHINGDKTDNRAENLAEKSTQLNCRNSRMKRNNTSGTTGICKRGSKWYASITDSGSQRHLGVFEAKFDAVIARLLAEKALGFSTRHGLAVKPRPSSSA